MTGESAQTRIDDDERAGESRDRSGRYRVRFDRRLPALDTPFAEAVEVVDSEDSSASLYGLVCRSGVPVRGEALETLRTLRNRCLLRLAAHSIAVHPRSGRQSRLLVLDRPAGGALFPAKGSPKPWSEDELIRRVLPALAEGLAALHGRGLIHRSLRPETIFFLDAKGSRIVIGECASASAGRSQPLVYEPIERAMAQPSGRGEGTPETDMFALGVTLVALLAGRHPLAGVDDDTVIARRLAVGSLGAIAGLSNTTPAMTELLTGLLTDVPKYRWTLERLQGWLAARRGGPTVAEPRHRSHQPYEFLGTGYDHPRALACAFGRHWDAARRAVRERRLALWLDRSVNNTEMARSVAAILDTAERGTGRKLLSEDELVGRICVILDPEGPVRYKSFAATLDGFGPALAEAMTEGSDEAIQIAGQVIASGLAARSIEEQPDGRTRLATLHSSFIKLEAMLRDRGRGYGVERCLYELNPSLPCRTPLLEGRWADNLDSLLEGLEAAANSHDPKISPLDRHVAAFIGSRLTIRDQEELQALGPTAADTGRDAIAALTVLALVQQRSEMHKLPNLTRWLAARLTTTAENLRNRRLRRQFKLDLAAAASNGSLARLFHVATDPVRARRDRQGFRGAVARRAQIRVELARIDRQDDAPQAIAEYYGHRIATGAAYLLLAIDVFGFAFGGMP